MKKLVRVFASVVVALSFVSVGAQAVNADQMNGVKLNSAEVMPTSSAIKKGQRIFVIVKDTKKQTVPVYNQNAKKTRKTVKMGSTFTVKAVKKVHGKKIAKVASSKWLNTKDVAQD